MKTFQTVKFLPVLFFVILTTGCASIVSKSKWPISVMSEPGGASVVITDKYNHQVFRGKTPTATKLKSGAGFFAKESYKVTISMPGYQTKEVNVECKLNAWYFGNIFFGGTIGMLIIDPATGAMYKLKTDYISEDLQPHNQSTQLNIIDLKDVSDSLKTSLVKLDVK